METNKKELNKKLNKLSRQYSKVVDMWADERGGTTLFKEQELYQKFNTILNEIRHLTTS